MARQSGIERDKFSDLLSESEDEDEVALDWIWSEGSGVLRTW